MSYLSEGGHLVIDRTNYQAFKAAMESTEVYPLSAQSHIEYVSGDDAMRKAFGHAGFTASKE